MVVVVVVADGDHSGHGHGHVYDHVCDHDLIRLSWDFGSASALSSPSVPSPSHRCTLALPPFASFSTSAAVAIEVSPSVVMDRAPWAAPSSTAFWPPAPMSSP